MPEKCVYLKPMSFEEHIGLLRQMISIPSVSTSEAEVADLLQRTLEAEGFTVHRKGNNIWLDSADIRPCDGPVILLNAHIDTVKPASSYTRDPFEASVEGDRIYGLGSNDDGASVIALLAAFRELVSRPQPYRLVWSATAEEENSGTQGVELIFPELGKIDFGIFGEPTGMRLAVAERGLMVLDCTSCGKSGHAARNEGENAIYKALADIEWFRSYQFPKVSDYLGPVKMTVTMISAGTQHNVVPDACKFVVDVRPNGLYDNAFILDYIKAHVSCEVVPRSMRRLSSHIEGSHPFVRKAVAEGLECFGSPTLSNWALASFPAVKLGPGESSRSHGADEFVCISEIRSAIDTYIKLLDGFCL